VSPVKSTQVVSICGFRIDTYWFPIQKRAYFRKVKESKKWRRGVLS